jgi:hypothetical protein
LLLSFPFPLPFSSVLRYVACVCDSWHATDVSFGGSFGLFCTFCSAFFSFWLFV